MRILASFLLINAFTFAQTMTEFGAVAAGSAVGGASGKSVSNGINAIFGKVDQQTAKAAAKEPKREKEPLAEALKVAPGTPKADPGAVPLPPAPPGKRTAPALPVAQFVVPAEVARFRSVSEVAPALPPPPVMSPEDLHSVSLGASRADVLKYGAPSSKITTFEDGHLVEFYSYHQNGQKFGGLKLTDGVVSSVQ